MAEPLRVGPRRLNAERRTIVTTERCTEVDNDEIRFAMLAAAGALPISTGANPVEVTGIFPIQ
jgi:hypothetical protein